jgi:N,N-dimethylformamidase beta subunit-like, C-terminal
MTAGSISSMATGRCEALHRRIPVCLGVTLAIIASVGLASCSQAGTRAEPPSKSTSTSTSSPPRAVSPTTLLGADGVESSAVIAENRRPGTSAWRIAEQGPGFIEGFADHNYAQRGESVGLFVSTNQPSFVVTAFRMGWYGGAGARQVWRSSRIVGSDQPACTLDHSTNMVSCDDWSKSANMIVTSAFVPGDYLLKLTASNNSQSYILLTIWQPASHATYLVLNRSLVEQGWNTFGGYDYYQGQGTCILDSNEYPPCNRARVVSFDRPYAGNGSSDFLTNEYPMVQFMEQEGLDVTYCTDICLSEHPGLLQQHRVLVDLDHDETWTNSEREAVLDAAAKGVNMAFFGAATLVRHARLQASPLGPDREEVDYRDSSEDPLDRNGSPWDVTGNTWSSPPTSWSAESFLGQLYSGYLEPNEPSAPMKVFDATSWFFKGTGLTAGEQIPSVINSDIEHLDPSEPMPQNLQVFAHSPVPLSEAYTNQGKWNGYTYSDVTYYTESPSGAGIFDSGDNVWVATLQPCSPPTAHCPASVMRKLTANVLRLFGQGPAGHREPSRANWQSVRPSGS